MVACQAGPALGLRRAVMQSRVYLQPPALGRPAAACRGGGGSGERGPGPRAARSHHGHGPRARGAHLPAPRGGPRGRGLQPGPALRPLLGALGRRLRAGRPGASRQLTPHGPQSTRGTGEMGVSASRLLLGMEQERACHAASEQPTWGMPSLLAGSILRARAATPPRAQVSDTWPLQPQAAARCSGPACRPQFFAAAGCQLRLCSPEACHAPVAPALGYPALQAKGFATLFACCWATLGATLRHASPGLKLGGLVSCKLAER